MARTSCGILILNAGRELLLCHATGTSHWDIPKGGPDPGEAEIDTARRETAEETGLEFEPEVLIELGRHPYRPGKALHLYATLTPRLDASRCTCRTHFIDRHGRSVPEMDRHAWVAFDDIHKRCAQAMTTLLTARLSLDAVLTQLVRAQRGDTPMLDASSA